MIGMEIYPENWTVRVNDLNYEYYYLSSIQVPIFQIGAILEEQKERSKLCYYIPTFVIEDDKVADIIFSNIEMKIHKKGDINFDDRKNSEFKNILF
jgi:hypothetical protein